MWETKENTRQDTTGGGPMSTSDLESQRGGSKREKREKKKARGGGRKIKGRPLWGGVSSRTACFLSGV